MPMDRQPQQCRLESNAPSVCRTGVLRINNNYGRAALLASGCSTTDSGTTTLDITGLILCGQILDLIYIRDYDYFVYFIRGKSGDP